MSFLQSLYPNYFTLTKSNQNLQNLFAKQDDATYTEFTYLIEMGNRKLAPLSTEHVIRREFGLKKGSNGANLKVESL